MSRSMLVYRDADKEAAPSLSTIIGLHGYGRDLDQLVSLGHALGPSVRLVTPQAARPVTPATHGPGWEDNGYTWYFGREVGHPEPATFGESLWQVEQFVWDVRDREGVDQPLFLFGCDQGGVLATTMVGVSPESLSGVAAVGGYLPDIRGWSLPVEDLKGLPVLLMHDPEDATIPEVRLQRTVDELARRGAAVELRPVPGAQEDVLAVSATLSQWLPTVRPHNVRSEGGIGHAGSSET